MSALLVLGEMTLTRIFQRPLLMNQQPFLWSMVAGNSHFYGCWSLTTTIYYGRWQITVTSDHFQSSKFSHCNSRTFANHVRWRRTSQESPTLEARESAHCRFCAGVCYGTFLKFDVSQNWRLIAHLLQTTQRIFGSVWNCWIYLTMLIYFVFRRAGSVSCGKENCSHLQHPIRRGLEGAYTTYRRTSSTSKWNGPKQTSKLCMSHSTPPCQHQAFIKRLVGHW